MNIKVFKFILFLVSEKFKSKIVFAPIFAC